MYEILDEHDAARHGADTDQLLNADAAPTLVAAALRDGSRSVSSHLEEEQAMTRVSNNNQNRAHFRLLPPHPPPCKQTLTRF